MAPVDQTHFAENYRSNQRIGPHREGTDIRDAVSDERGHPGICVAGPGRQLETLAGRQIQETRAQWLVRFF